MESVSTMLAICRCRYELEVIMVLIHSYTVLQAPLTLTDLPEAVGVSFHSEFGGIVRREIRHAESAHHTGFVDDSSSSLLD